MSPEEFEKYKKECFDFLWNEVAPLEKEIELTGKIPKKKLWPKFRDYGFFGLVIPQKYGGKELSETQFLEFEKEWSKIHGGIRGILHVHSVSCILLNMGGTEEQKRKYLPKMATGDLSMAFCLTEQFAGTGKDIKTTAKKEGDYYILNGEKHLITNADFTQLFAVVCYTESEKGRLPSILIVERGTSGFLIEDMGPIMGCTGLGHGRLTFKNVKVPKENLLGGDEGKGLDYALTVLNLSRLHIAATGLGTCERCLELALEYAQKRITFGKPIIERQAVQNYLAEIATLTYALKTMIMDAAKKFDEGKDITMEANMCKLFTIEATRRVTDNAILVFGGRGYLKEYSIERLYRDARLNWLEEGTPTIQNLVITRELVRRGF